MISSTTEIVFGNKTLAYSVMPCILKEDGAPGIVVRATECLKGDPKTPLPLSPKLNIVFKNEETLKEFIDELHKGRIELLRGLVKKEFEEKESRGE